MKLPDKAELLERYSQYSDQELLQVLRHSRDYQQAAVDAATDIAKERRLAWTVDSATESQSRFSLFPKISDPKRAAKVAQSIQRVLYIVALVPVLFAALYWVDGYSLLAFAAGVIALCWVLAAFFSLKYRKAQIVWLFFLLISLLLSVCFQRAGSLLPLNRMDWMVISIGLIVFVYLLLFYKSILKSGV